MSGFYRGIVIAAFAIALAGCAVGDISVGGLLGPTADTYEITGAGFDESFEMAHRAIGETGLEIVHADKAEGRIAARAESARGPYQDVRTIEGKPAGFEFDLERKGPGTLAFSIESTSKGERLAERFLDRYSRYIEFSDPSGGKEADASETPGGVIGSESVVTEIRTGSPPLPEKEYDLSRQEIIELQAFLYKLGYDPGPANGVLNDKTLKAIGEFKSENGFIEKLF